MITLREVDILGIFVSPALVCLLVAVILSALLRRLFDRIQLDRYVWNRTLFDLAVLVCSTDLLVLSLRSAAR
jgi:protein AaeX